MGITIGIDLGTTNSVASIKKISVTKILSAEGEELTPSCVTAVPNATVDGSDLVVGRRSFNLLKQYPEQTVVAVKRLMGRDFEDLEVQRIIKENIVSYKIVTEESEPGSIFIPLLGQLYTPSMISGIILKKLIQDCEQELQGQVEQAVVTVPAYFSDRQKFATRAACDYAGIKLLRLLPEPTAAALSFGIETFGKTDFCTIMVFDLGGGTFDVSVLSLAGGNFMEITKGGDMWLGGEDIDQLLVDYVLERAQKSANCLPIMELVNRLGNTDRARFLVELKEKAEIAKIELSSREYATISMFGLLRDENNQLIDIDVTISRTKFNELIEPVVNKVASIAGHILHEVRFEPNLIDVVLMVGGSSNILAIQNKLKEMFGVEKVMLHPRPMLAVAEGAAIMAAKMISQENDEPQTFEMMHSTAHDYYLQLAGGKRHLLVARNTPLPVRVEESLKFANPKQYFARLRVFNEIDGILEPVGELWFHKEDNAKYLDGGNRLTEFMLEFGVSEDNIITMKACLSQNKRHSVETQIARGGLTSKLYNDLERTISSSILNCQNFSVEHDLLRLSNTVISTILAATDPFTGETRVAKKQLAEQQINTLKACQQQKLSPLGVYNFAIKAYSIGSYNILTIREKARLKNIITEFERALEQLDDAGKFKNLENKLKKFYAEVPIIAELTRAHITCEALAKIYPHESKQLANQIKTTTDLYVTKNLTLLAIARDKLDELISDVEWSDHPSGCFDRDVIL